MTNFILTKNGMELHTKHIETVEFFKKLGWIVKHSELSQLI